MPEWSFLTNHALVLLHVSHWPDSTGLEIAQAVGITERATRRIVDDLEAVIRHGAYLQRSGRRLHDWALGHES